MPEIKLLFSDPIPQLDVAVMTHVSPQITFNTGKEHFIDLDPIPISEAHFKKIFYNTDSFSVTPRKNLTPQDLQFITFAKQTNLSSNFHLFDTLRENILTDLGTSIDMISPASLVKLQKDINKIETLCELTATGNLGLKWSEIINILKHNNNEKDQKFYHSDEYDDDTSYVSSIDGNSRGNYNGLSRKKKQVIFTITTIFATPSEQIKHTHIKFNFLTTLK